MKSRPYKIASYWITPSNLRYPRPQDQDLMADNVTLLEGKPRKRRCRFHMNGPDGIWSWIVAFANFLVNFIIVGLGRMSGILYVEFMYFFNIDRMTASIPFSIQQAGRNLFGPLAGILGQKYGLRFVTILGGLIGSFSAATMYYRMDIESITLMWGLFFGMSTALTTTLNQISIDQYFEKHRATAGGFAFSGGCFGAFIFPVILEILIEKYAMKGAFLILGAIILFVVPAAMMLVEPPWLENKEEVSQTTSKYGSLNKGEPSKLEHADATVKANDQLSKDDGTGALQALVDFTVLQINSDMVFQFLTMEIPDKSTTLNTNKNDFHKLDQKRLMHELECIYASVYPIPDSSSSDITSFSAEEVSNLTVHFKNSSSDNTEYETNNLRISDGVPRRVYIQNRLKELYEARGVNLVSHFPYWEQFHAWKVLIELLKLYEILNDKQHMKSIYKNRPEFRSSKRPKSKPQKNQENSNTFINLIKTAIKLHGNPIFLLVCLCRGVFMLTFIPVVTIIVDFAMDQGLPKSDGKYIIATLSLGDLVGRLCLGWITDCRCLSLPRYMLLGMLVLGGSTASLPLMDSKSSLFTAVLIFGILQGSLFVRHPLLISQYLKKEEQAIGMGFINFLSGFLGFALPAFIGYFRDKIGSYNNMFYINGTICGAVGLIWILEPLFVQICTEEANEKTNKRTSKS